MKKSPSRAYIGFILWGIAQGFLSYLILAFLAPVWWGNGEALFGILVVSGATSAIVFALLLTKPRWIKLCGFFIVGLLLPWFVAIGSDSLYYGRFYVADPLTLIFVCVWSILLLPALIASAVIYWFAADYFCSPV